jgi:hypothetical protein
MVSLLLLMLQASVLVCALTLVGIISNCCWSCKLLLFAALAEEGFH